MEKEEILFFCSFGEFPFLAYKEAIWQYRKERVGEVWDFFRCSSTQWIKWDAPPSHSKGLGGEGGGGGGGRGAMNQLSPAANNARDKWEKRKRRGKEGRDLRGEVMCLLGVSPNHFPEFLLVFGLLNPFSLLFWGTDQNNRMSVLGHQGQEKRMTHMIIPFSFVFYFYFTFPGYWHH